MKEFNKTETLKLKILNLKKINKEKNKSSEF